MTDDYVRGAWIKPTEGAEREASSPFTYGLWLLSFAATAVIAGVLIIGYQNVESYKSLGAWGDFTGGLLNPILTFITFFAVLITIWLQRQELSLTRKELERSATALEKQDSTLKKQSFENTFFEMLKLHNSILDSIDLVNKDNRNITKGRDAFSIFYTRFTKIYRENYEKLKDQNSKKEIAELSYFLFWKDAKTELGHYFRFLYNFFRFIEKSEIQEEFYPKLLRSQLSDQELLILFYNNISVAGQAFRHYADHFELFDNLPVERLLDSEHAEFANERAFGKNPMNFKPFVPKIGWANDSGE